MGPWIVPATEMDGQDVQLQCWVNGELRQVSWHAINVMHLYLPEMQAVVFHMKVVHVLLLSFCIIL